MELRWGQFGLNLGMGWVQRKEYGLENWQGYQGGPGKIAKLTKAVPKGQSKLRQDTCSGHWQECWSNFWARQKPWYKVCRPGPSAGLGDVPWRTPAYKKEHGERLLGKVWISLDGTGKIVVENTDNNLIILKAMKLQSGDKGSKIFQKAGPLCGQDLPKSFLIPENLDWLGWTLSRWDSGHGRFWDWKWVKQGTRTCLMWNVVEQGRTRSIGGEGGRRQKLREAWRQGSAYSGQISGFSKTHLISNELLRSESYQCKNMY